MSRSLLRIVALVLVAGGWWSAPVSAQTVNVTFSTYTITFPSADPDTTPVVSSQTLTVTYRVRNNWGGNWRIVMLASGDLSSGSAVIPVSNLTWVATPAPPFQSGTMSRTTAQTLASGSGNIDPSRTAQLTFRLTNSWAYDAGTYSALFTITITAP